MDNLQHLKLLRLPQHFWLTISRKKQRQEGVEEKTKLKEGRHLLGVSLRRTWPRAKVRQQDSIGLRAGCLGAGVLRFPPLTSLPADTCPQGNYVLDRDDLVEAQTPEYDVVLCLSLTKWVHLNWGDEGLKRMFRRIYRHLRPGGILVLEPQPWSSYGKRKTLTVSWVWRE